MVQGLGCPSLPARHCSSVGDVVRVRDLVPWSSVDVVLEDAAKHAHIYSTSNNLHRKATSPLQAALCGRVGGIQTKRVWRPWSHVLCSHAHMRAGSLGLAEQPEKPTGEVQTWLVVAVAEMLRVNVSAAACAQFKPV